VRLGKEYPNLPPLYVTENGSAWDDVITPDGEIHDAERVDYLERHLEAIAAGIAEGADVRGYFAWSLLDNFEWAWGYEKRFGIIHVDYETLVRTIKDSGHTFARIAKESRPALA
jgi:beta-glucosidase